jgi:hypothetical protein
MVIENIKDLPILQISGMVGATAAAIERSEYFETDLCGPLHALFGLL